MSLHLLSRWGIWKRGFLPESSERDLGQSPALGVFGGPVGLGTKGQVRSGEFTGDGTVGCVKSGLGVVLEGPDRAGESGATRSLQRC